MTDTNDIHEFIEKIEVWYINKWGERWPDYRPHQPYERVRLSVWITPEDSHHIELHADELSRYRLSGLLMNLAHSIARGVK